MGEACMISIAIVEDHLVLVEALELLLSSEGDISIAGSADNFSDGQEMLQRIKPDVLLLDVGLPDGNGLDLIPIVQAKTPETKIIVLSCLTDENTLIRAIDGGVTGFISKGSSLSKLLSTIRKVAKGEIVLPSSLLFGLLKRYPRDKAVISVEEQLWERLTPREQEVLAHLAHGKSGEDIASTLHIAPLTVRTHVRNLMSKLGAHSRLEAVAFGLKYGLIEAVN
jgi:DNA-binding NarL/FixJ family response regulator